MEYQKAAGQPPENFDFWNFQGDEWDAYIEYDADIYNFANRASDEFIVGMRDPNSDADWQQFQEELKLYTRMKRRSAPLRSYLICRKTVVLT